MVASRGATSTAATNNAPGEKVAPVDLLAASVPVQFQIKDLRAWTYNHSDATKLLEKLATHAIVRYFVGVDLFEVMSSERAKAAVDLKNNIQALADNHNLGVEIVLVGLQDIHPPVKVAKKFEEVNAARQENEAAMRTAEGYAAKPWPWPRGREKSPRGRGLLLPHCRRRPGAVSAIHNQLMAFAPRPKCFLNARIFQPWARRTNSEIHSGDHEHAGCAPPEPRRQTPATVTCRFQLPENRSFSPIRHIPDMKRNTVTLVIGALLVLIFFVLLFTFQVRQTEVAVVTTFDKPTRFIDKPGCNSGGAPIQKWTSLTSACTASRDDSTVLTRGDPVGVLYVGWSIKNPTNFFSSFRGGNAAAAEPSLGGLIESAKNEVVGKHPFSHFVSTDPKELKFDEIEDEILKKIRPDAEAKYGIDVRFVGIKKLGLPESVTEKVFARMQAERTKVVEILKSAGELEASKIRSAADTERQKLLADAHTKAMALRGQADAEASKSFSVFNQNPDLAIFLLQLRALEETLKEKATLIWTSKPRRNLVEPVAKGAPATEWPHLGHQPK